jgi:hypothetical protein
MDGYYMKKKKINAYNLKTKFEFHFGNLFCGLEKDRFNSSCLGLDKKKKSDISVPGMQSQDNGGWQWFNLPEAWMGTQQYLGQMFPSTVPDSSAVTENKTQSGK